MGNCTTYTKHKLVKGIKWSLLGFTYKDKGGKSVSSVWIVPILGVLVTATTNPVYHNQNNAYYGADCDPNIKSSVVTGFWLNTIVLVNCS